MKRNNTTGGGNTDHPEHNDEVNFSNPQFKTLIPHIPSVNQQCQHRALAPRLTTTTTSPPPPTSATP